MIDYEAFISLDRVAVVDGLPSRKTALHQLAEYLARSAESMSPRDIFFKLEERERQGSTVLDDLPVAIPHCRLVNCPFPTGSLLKIQGGNAVDFGGQDVRLIIGMCFPQDAAEEALTVLRLVVKLIDDEQSLPLILAADTQELLYERFRGRLLAEAES